MARYSLAVIQSDIFPKFKMAVAAILDFQIMWIWPFRGVDCVVFVLYQIG